MHPAAGPYGSCVARVTLCLVAANVLLIAIVVTLRLLWFDGSVGCDDEGVPATAECYRRGDILVYLAWAEIVLFGATVLWMAGRGLLRLSTRGPERNRA